jgi:bifunctional non-homologous end joining protein LigD
LQKRQQRSAVLDAELCAVSDAGAPDFRAMQSAMARCEGLAVFAFDLLHRDGADLRQKPLEERRRRLARLLGRKAIPCLHLVEAFEDGAALLKAAEAHGFEGIVSKRRSSPYVSGACRDWCKFKTATWWAANRERWRMFRVQSSSPSKPTRFIGATDKIGNVDVGKHSSAVG